MRYRYLMSLVVVTVLFWAGNAVAFCEYGGFRSCSAAESALEDDVLAFKAELIVETYSETGGDWDLTWSPFCDDDYVDDDIDFYSGTFQGQNFVGVTIPIYLEPQDPIFGSDVGYCIPTDWVTGDEAYCEFSWSNQWYDADEYFENNFLGGFCGCDLRWSSHYQDWHYVMRCTVRYCC